jgi:hypothetical protein
MMLPISPTCLAKSEANAFSVAVLVSAVEFAKSSSMRVASWSALAGSPTRTMYQPMMSAIPVLAPRSVWFMYS